ncbi:MAG: c-type cytochrome, partial [Planctomycetota bacterium]
CGGMGCSTEGDPLENMFKDGWEKSQKLTGTAEAGKKYMLENTYDAGMACVACHSIDANDTMTTDADGQVRAGVSIFGAKHRNKVKPMGSSNVALGGNLCVPYWQNGPKHGATPQEIADMAAYIESLPAAKDHATAANVNYKRKSTIPATLTGGDAVRGAEMAGKYCQTCHGVDGKDAIYDIGEKKLKPGVVPTQYLIKLAKRIRDTGKKNNDFMPGFVDDRMPEQDLLDLLAFFEKK